MLANKSRCIVVENVMTNRVLKSLTNIWTAPFAQPKLGVLYGIFSGIILVMGTNFVFGIFKEDTILPWGIKQWAGVCFVGSSIVLSLVAFLMQFFNDHLIRSGTENARFAEKCEQFDSGKWGGRRLTRLLFALFWVFLIAGIGLLILAYWKAAP